MKKKPLSKGARVLLILAVIVAMITGYGVYQFLDQQNTTVYVYTGAYEAGTPLTSDMFAKVSYPVNLYNAVSKTGTGFATLTQISDSISSGDCLIMATTQYTPVMSNHFASSGGSGIENRLDENMVSVELPVDDIAGLGGDIRIGTRVNLLSSYTKGESRCTELIFQNLLIVDIKDDVGGAATSVFVEVSPEESLQLIHAMSFESVTATVLKPHSYEAVEQKKSLYERTYTNQGSGYSSAGQ